MLEDGCESLDIESRAGDEDEVVLRIHADTGTPCENAVSERRTPLATVRVG